MKNKYDFLSIFTICIVICSISMWAGYAIGIMDGERKVCKNLAGKDFVADNYKCYARQPDGNLILIKYNGEIK